MSARNRCSRLVAASAALSAAIATGALAAPASAPTITGPVTLVAGGCQAHGGCGYDFTLAPTATADPTRPWHAYWVETGSARGQAGWCTIEATATLAWGGGAPPVATYPGRGSTTVAARSTATLPLDAGGTATSPGRLAGGGMPPGIITTWVGAGHMTSLWQGRSTVDPILVLAAELDNPTDPAPPAPGLADDYSIGLPCADFAPPGNTFLARFAHPTIRLGQTAYLELRIPKTGMGEQTVDGSATVQMIGGLGPGFTTRTRPQLLRFADRWTFQTRPGFGRWAAIVTLRGPTGVRRYRVPLTVKA